MNKAVFDRFPVLHTQRMRLKALNIGLLQDLLPIVFYKDKEVKDRGKVLEIIEKIQMDFFKHTGITWGMFYEQKLVGTCGYYRGFENDIGEVGYVLNADYRGLGLMKEGLAEVVRFGFEQLQLVEIRAYTADDNLPSIAVLKHLGFNTNTAWVDGQPGFSLRK